MKFQSILSHRFQKNMDRGLILLSIVRLTKFLPYAHKEKRVPRSFETDKHADVLTHTVKNQINKSYFFDVS